MSKSYFLTFQSIHGGYLYESQLYRSLSHDNSRLKLISAARKNKTLMTLFSYANVFIRSILVYPTAKYFIRPFGFPLYKPYSFIVFHHFDPRFDPWYSRLLDICDFMLLKLLNPIFHFKFIVVSSYWKSFLHSHGFTEVSIIYNNPTIALTPLISKVDIANLYELNPHKKWIFLGEHSYKKGTYGLSQSMPRFLLNDYVFIVSSPSDSANLLCRRIDSSHYSSFLHHCSLVIAPSIFLEGWSRLLHDAALAGAPICGSGSGGMSELLELTASPKFSHYTQVFNMLTLQHFPSPDASTLNSHILHNNLQSIQRVSNTLR